MALDGKEAIDYIENNSIQDCITEGSVCEGNFTYGKPYFKQWPGSLNASYICGNFCSIASNVKVYLGGNHRTDWVTTYPFGHIHTDILNTTIQGHPATRGDVIIGNDVWIADNVTIMSGVHVGDGAVIACNSHVVKDVEPYSIVGGNPAKFIKYRFTHKQIKSSLKIQWWNWSVKKINDNLHLLCNDKIDEFIDKHNNPCVT